MVDTLPNSDVHFTGGSRASDEEAAGAASDTHVLSNSMHVPAVSERYESLNYEALENELTQKNVKSRSSLLWRVGLNRWTVCFLTGLGTACTGAAIKIGIEKMVDWKFTLLQKHFNDCQVDCYCLIVPALMWVGINAFFTSIAAVLVVFISGPVAGGSGIPQIKCFLNGVKIPGVVTLKTYLAKAVGVLFSVSGGLSVGKEGPMIHSGACVAARVSQGRFGSGIGKTVIDCHCFEYYRTDTELRDFVAAGAASGVAAAFGAPIGGVLFSLEEGASFWNQGLTWRMFFASMTSGFILNLIMSWYQHQPGQINYKGLVNFGTFDSSKGIDVNYDYIDLLIYCCIGVLGGLLGAAFNYLNFKLTLYRMNYSKQKWKKLLEVIIISVVSAGVGLLSMFFVADCTPLDDHVFTDFPVQLYCPHGEYSSMAALFMNAPETSVRFLLHQPRDVFKAYTLAVFAFIQFFLALWTYGASVPSGLFIPSLLVGAAWSRLLALGLAAIFRTEHISNNVGLYALAGAAAQLGGNVRMTISLCVILIEATHNIGFGLPLMIVLMIAKWVGDLFNEGLYDIHIDLAEVPLLKSEPPHLSACISAKRVMARPVIVLNEVERVGDICDALRSKHQGFPVVDDYQADTVNSETFGRYRGLIQRAQLIVLLEHKAFSRIPGGEPVGRADLEESDFIDLYPKYDRFLMRLSVTSAERNCYLDLRPFMNKAPYAVSLDASLTKMYQLFRGLGLRHCVVVDDDNRVAGIVTRKDIARFRSELKQGRVHQHELFISENPAMNMGT